MKKRILALALVIVTLVTVLTGCAYRYDKKDMSKYATVADNYAGLDALLKEITIKGADFGPYVKGNDYKRNDKVLEKIDATLAGKIGTDAAKLSGDAAFGLRQKIFYAYYCTVEKDGVTYYFDTKNMDDAKLQSFLSNPKYANGTATNELVLTDAVTKAIYEALSKDGGLKIEDYKYDSDSSSATELKAGDRVFVSYKYTYTENGASKSVSSEYMLIDVEDKVVIDGETMKATKIGQLLAGKKIGKIEGTTENPLEFYVDDVKYVVDSMTVHFKSTGKEISVPYTATAAKDYTNAANTATDSKVKVAKDDVITYHVFPAYVNAVAELNATSIVNTIFGESITISSLDIFTENEKMKPLVEAIGTLKTAYDQANSAVTSAGSNATQAQKNTRDEAKKKLDDAVAALPGKLLATSTDAEKLIVDAYKESVYESLEATYDSEIQKQIGQALWAWVEANVKVDTANLPKAAVKEAKERILAGHKNDYHTGQDSTTKIAYTETYKTFNEYLAAVAYKGKTEGVDAAVDAEAKAQVVDLVRVYAVAQHYSANVARVTNADVSIYIDELYPQLYYTFYLQGNYYPTTQDIKDLYGETALRAALTFDRIMDYFLATEEVDGHVQYKTVKSIKFEG